MTACKDCLALTPKEWETIKLYAVLGNTRLVAQKLEVVPRTAESHLNNTRIKLGVSSSFLAVKILFKELEIHLEEIDEILLTAKEKCLVEALEVSEENHDLAALLGIEYKTIEAHFSRIYVKSQLRNRVQLYTYNRLFPGKFILTTKRRCPLKNF